MIRHFNANEIAQIERKVRCGLPVAPDVLADACEHIMRNAEMVEDLAQEQIRDLELSVQEAEDDAGSAQVELHDAEEKIGELTEKIEALESRLEESGTTALIADLEQVLVKAKAGAACA